MQFADELLSTEQADGISTYKGQCFCGAVQFSVSGAPVAMGYCHCDSCRKWSSAPVNAFTLWKSTALKITQGAIHIGSFRKTLHSNRKWCRTCGSHLFTDHPQLGLTDVYAEAIPDFPFRPGVHIHYREASMRIRDGLPKMNDLPANMGGSGATLAE